MSPTRTPWVGLALGAVALAGAWPWLVGPGTAPGVPGLVGDRSPEALADGLLAASLAGLALTLGILGGRRRGGPRRTSGIRVLSGLGGALAGAALVALSLAQQPDGPRLRGPVAVVGQVVGSPVGRGLVVEVQATRTVGTPTWRPAHGRLSARWPRDHAHRPTPGEPVLLWGRARAVEDALRSLPGAPDPVRQRARDRIRTHLDAHDATRLGGDVPPDPRAQALPGLLRALAHGDRSAVDPTLLHRLRATGTAHLLAISGFHVGLVALAAALVVRAVRGLVAVVRPGGVDDRLEPVGAAVAAALFALGVGAPVSARRAATGVALVAAARLLGRPVDAPVVVAWVATGMVVLEPSVVGSASFQLSFGAVAGLLAWASPIRGWLGTGWEHRTAVTPAARAAHAVAGRVADALAASLAASLGTLPAAAWWFQAFGPTSPVANLFAMPWTATVLVPCAFTAAWAPEPVAGVAMAVGEWATAVLSSVLGALTVPVWRPAVGSLGALALAAVLALVPRRPGPLAVGLWLVLGLRPLPHGTLVLTFLDVGQGDAAVVREPRGRTWLIDGGWRDGPVTAWLRRTGQRHVHDVVASHADRDHAGGLSSALATLRVERLHLTHRDPLRPLVDTARARGVSVVTEPHARWWPDPDHGDHEAVPVDDNDASVVVTPGQPTFRALFPGDLESTTEGAVADRVGPVDLLKVAHHGSATSTTPRWLDRVQPRVAVLSVGRGNLYGHPSPAVVERLVDRGIALLRTDVHGTIRLRVDASGAVVDVRTHRAGWGWRPWTGTVPPSPTGCPASPPWAPPTDPCTPAPRPSPARGAAAPRCRGAGAGSGGCPPAAPTAPRSPPPSRTGPG